MQVRTCCRADELESSRECWLDHLTGVDAAFRLTEVEEGVYTARVEYVGDQVFVSIDGTYEARL